ncbi:MULTISPECIES: hypothetical protein [Thermoactinomyces]|jgi:hypothetical protein|uniref:Uncharacterized protein n=1 Tax=Thermoactinomyces daqus TaxID=1329516 RepID=A0A7W2AJB7_9BACL|nr:MULTISPECIES: hypothetical protein [Thermoactinomyces]MBA4543763.1 hypothetical protein [Thermoactinomyces daqus]MBH8598386.1 hypothetical protein [Thermoactinomyces sp. CICC 10523]MBH8604511.1 hypothetical protein [Thermoactinomyces sp. CICC 10522]MBH8607486.1 hypothetical protein [Thermoactinomyces sp. CICC 10521]
MASHYSSIGFCVESDEEWVQLLERCNEMAESRENEQSRYLLWKVSEEIELILPLDEEGKVFACHPHFAGKGRMKATLEHFYPGSKYPLDITLLAWVKHEISHFGEMTGDFPFVFDPPEYGSFLALKPFPRSVNLQIAAFAHRLQCFIDEEDYLLAQESGGLMYAAESFVPIGMFVENDKDPEAIAFFSGKVLEAEKKQNPETGAEFWYLLVKTLGGTIDVVADPELMAGVPVEEGIVCGEFWLSGKLAEE